MKARLFAIVLLIACKSGVEPLDGDLYVLSTAAGRNLPTAYSDLTVNKIYADTIAMHLDGRGVRRWVTDSYQGTKKTEEFSFSFVKTGTHFEMTIDCADAASCVSPPHMVGTFTTADELTISQSKVTLTPMVYRRATLPD